MLLKDVEF